MAVGEFENITSGPGVDVTFNRIGWTLEPGDVLPFDNDDNFRDDLLFVKEVEDAVAAGTIEVRDGSSTVVPVGLIQDFLRGDNVTTGELQAQAVTKTKIDVSTPGDAAITNVVAGSGISISETGADTGTGAVTINKAAGSDKAIVQFQAQLDVKVEKTGLTWLKHDKVPHNTAGITLTQAGTLKFIWVNTGIVDSVEAWEIRLYRNPTSASRVLVHTEVMATGIRVYSFTGLSVALIAGEYGLAFAPNGTNTSNSAWSSSAAGMGVEVTV